VPPADLVVARAERSGPRVVPSALVEADHDGTAPPGGPTTSVPDRAATAPVDPVASKNPAVHRSRGGLNVPDSATPETTRVRAASRLAGRSRSAAMTPTAPAVRAATPGETNRGVARVPPPAGGARRTRRTRVTGAASAVAGVRVRVRANGETRKGAPVSGPAVVSAGVTPSPGVTPEVAKAETIESSGGATADPVVRATPHAEMRDGPEVGVASLATTADGRVRAPAVPRAVPTGPVAVPVDSARAVRRKASAPARRTEKEPVRVRMTGIASGPVRRPVVPSAATEAAEASATPREGVPAAGTNVRAAETNARAAVAASGGVTAPRAAVVRRSGTRPAPAETAGRRTRRDRAVTPDRRCRTTSRVPSSTPPRAAS
jgi:hypothetical protein